MIVWINGAFGSGKTGIAFELSKRLPGSFVFDPENFGYYLQKSLPKFLQTDDFQDEPLWRDVNYMMLKKLSSEHSGHIIVPMTVTSGQYRDELIGKLRQDGVRVDHYLLEASRKTLQKRLKKRFEGNRSWSVLQIDRCLNTFEASFFEGRIQTDNMSFTEITDFIGKQSALDLIADNESKLRKRLSHFMNQIRHIKI